MPNKRRSSSLFQNASRQLKLFVFLAKLKKPLIPLLVCLKKTRRLNKFKLRNHYNYYVKEYEFSPSNTPLIQFRRKPKSLRLFSFRKVYSNVCFMSECLGMVRADEGGQNERGRAEIGLEYSFPSETENPLNRGLVTMDLWDYDESDDSVDEKAEIFIQRFYEDMRRQRLESHDQLNSVLEM